MHRQGWRSHPSPRSAATDVGPNGIDQHLGRAGWGPSPFSTKMIVTLQVGNRRTMHVKRRPGMPQIATRTIGTPGLHDRGVGRVARPGAPNSTVDGGTEGSNLATSSGESGANSTPRLRQPASCGRTPRWQSRNSVPAATGTRRSRVIPPTSWAPSATLPQNPRSNPKLPSTTKWGQIVRQRTDGRVTGNAKPNAVPFH